MTTKIFALDDCCIIHSKDIEIPPSYRSFFGGRELLSSKNSSKLNAFILKLHKDNLKPFRFVPSKNLEKNFLKETNERLRGVNLLMMNPLRMDIISQLKKFMTSLDSFETIERIGEFDFVKPIFQENEIDLKKNSNIPEPEDCQIIATFQKIDGQKVLISEDEHFWVYADLIKKHFDIQIYPEWNCHLIKI